MVQRLRYVHSYKNHNIVGMLGYRLYPHLPRTVGYVAEQQQQLTRPARPFHLDLFDL